MIRFRSLLTAAALAAGLVTGQAVAPTVIASVAAAAPVYEDDPVTPWACARGGNRICGPGNPNHAPAGFYNRRGQMVKAWTNFDHPWRDDLSGVWPAPDALYGSKPLPEDQVPPWHPKIVWTDEMIKASQADYAAGRYVHS